MTTETPSEPSATFELFPRLSPLLVVLLTLVTLGFYVPYWLYTRTRIIDKMYKGSPIPSLFMALCMGGYIALLVLVYQIPANLTVEQIMQSEGFGHLMDVAVILNIIQLCWACVFLQRINACSGAKPGESLHGSYFFLVLTHLIIVNVYYLQYKINQIVDSRQQPDNTIGLM